jgi:hypothetical protein
VSHGAKEEREDDSADGSFDAARERQGRDGGRAEVTRYSNEVGDRYHLIALI